jgi:hypothetical protein
LPGAGQRGSRQRETPGKAAFAGCQSSAVGKIYSLPGAVTRQNMTVGKVAQREGGHLPSAFARCHAVRHPTKVFYFFLTKSLLGAMFVGTRQINLLF